MPTLPFDLAVWTMLIMVALAAVSDLRTGLISNRTVGLGALLGLLAQLAMMTPVSLEGLGVVLLRVLLGAVLCALVPLVLYVLGGLGGGDVKLFIAIGVCTGPLAGIEVQLVSFLVTLLFVPFYLLHRGQLRATLHNSAALLRNMFRSRARRIEVTPSEQTMLRFAPSIFVAAAWVALRPVLWS